MNTTDYMHYINDIDIHYLIVLLAAGNDRELGLLNECSHFCYLLAFRIIKPLATYRMSRWYLPGVATT